MTVRNLPPTISSFTGPEVDHRRQHRGLLRVRLGPQRNDAELQFGGACGQREHDHHGRNHRQPAGQVQRAQAPSHCGRPSPAEATRSRRTRPSRSLLAVTATSVSDITATTSTFGGTTNLSAKVSPLNAPGSVDFFVGGSSTAAAGTVTYNQSTGVATLSNYTHGLNASNTAYSVKAVFTPSGSSHSSSQATNASALTVGKASSTTDVTCTAGAVHLHRLGTHTALLG